jgi:hypothetical protein
VRKSFRLTRKMRQNPDLVIAERERRFWLHRKRCNARIPNLCKTIDAKYAALGESMARLVWRS